MTPQDRDTLARQRLRENLREFGGDWTCSQIARAINCSHSTIYRLAHEEDWPFSGDVGKKLLVLLGIEVTVSAEIVRDAALPESEDK